MANADDAAMEVTNTDFIEPPLDAEDPESFGVGNDEEIGKEIALTTDEGVVKKILVPGSGWEKPEKGDIVQVHYVGTLKDGTKFDSSRDRNDPFTFNLGEGRVIKGWDIGVASMLKGEKAILTCRADYAYGEQGSPPKIPPNATLDFEVELLSWTSVKDIAGDGGVIKTIVSEGTGWRKPADKDEVVVEFTATVSGEKEPFLSTGPKGETFTLLEGYKGMRGIGVAVATMKQSEHVKLVLKPDYAYGTKGLDGKVPGNATIDVDLKLLAVRQVENVTDDGLVTKKTVQESNDWKRPNEGATATIRVTGRLSDGTVFLSHPENHELSFVTDENQVPEGLDAAVMKMRINERALITVAPAYGYGEQGKPLDTQPMEMDGGVKVGQVAAVPPNATLTYEVELVKLENVKDAWEMSDEEKVAAAAAKKEKANAAYREGRVARAVAIYQKAVSDITNDKTFTDDLKTKARELRRAIHLNLAAAYLKQQDWKNATDQASKVLELDPTNVKALYRRAQAYIGNGEFVEAEQDIKRGLLEEADNKDLLALYKKLKVMLRESAKREAAIYGKMFKAVKVPHVKPHADSPADKPDTAMPVDTDALKSDTTAKA